MTEDELLGQLATKIEDLGWDYDRMSESGKTTYDEIMVLIAKLMQ